MISVFIIVPACLFDRLIPDFDNLSADCFRRKFRYVIVYMEFLFVALNRVEPFGFCHAFLRYSTKPR